MAAALRAVVPPADCARPQGSPVGVTALPLLAPKEEGLACWLLATVFAVCSKEPSPGFLSCPTLMPCVATHLDLQDHLLGLWEHRKPTRT